MQHEAPTTKAARPRRHPHHAPRLARCAPRRPARAAQATPRRGPQGRRGYLGRDRRHRSRLPRPLRRAARAAGAHGQALARHCGRASRPSRAPRPRARSHVVRIRKVSARQGATLRAMLAEGTHVLVTTKEQQTIHRALERAGFVEVMRNAQHWLSSLTPTGRWFAMRLDLAMHEAAAEEALAAQLLEI